MIRYLTNADIDRVKWDNVISTSCYETVYGYSWYLDLVAEHWDALVEDDYAAVMPLPWNRKYSFRYIYQPVNCQQLGIFTADPPGRERIRAFLDNIPGSFSLADMCLNSSNMEVPHGLKFSTYRNYIIYLNDAYEKLSNRYSTNAKRNLAKATGIDLRTAGLTTDEFIGLKSSGEKGRYDRAKYGRMKKIIESLVREQHGEVQGTWVNGELCAAVFWVYSSTRIIYLLSVSSELGKENRAMFLMVDALIRRHQESNKILDFEGSNIPTIARFFEGFGANPEEYYRLTLHRSVLLKLLAGKRLKTKD